MVNPLGGVTLQVVLRITYRLICRAGPRSACLRAMLSEALFVFRLRIKSGAGGYCELRGGQLTVSPKRHPQPTLEQGWPDGSRAVLSPDETTLLRAFGVGHYYLRGYFTKVLRVVEALKIARPRKLPPTGLGKPAQP